MPHNKALHLTAFSLSSKPASDLDSLGRSHSPGESTEQSMTSHLPDIPLTPEASDLVAKLLSRIERRLEEVKRTPVSVLLWGPGIDSTSPLAAVRLNLRQLLRANGHAAFYSEELCNPASGYSPRIQQLAQAHEFDLIVSTPCTPGSIGEIHDFAADRRVHAKLLVFLNEEHVSGYSPQSLSVLETVISCEISYYPDERSLDGSVELTLNNVKRIQDMKWVLAGRY